MLPPKNDLRKVRKSLNPLWFEEKSSGKSSLVFVEAFLKINAAVYKNVLKKVLKPWPNFTSEKPTGASNKILLQHTKRSRRALAEPGECEKYARVRDARTASGATELVRKSRNVALKRRKIDFWDEETRWSCCKSRDIGRGFKAVLCGSPRTTSGVGMIVFKRFRDAIASVERFDDRMMKIVVAVEERPWHFFSAYAPQTGCSKETKDEFWSLLDENTAGVPSQDMVVVAGDIIGHVGATKDGYICHDGFGFVLVRRRLQGLVTDAKPCRMRLLPRNTVR
ncbi:unnamed protein product [Heligmosomoides polygyrus]|uniref:RRM domain-containing protein n=1 Tax=Heligmosomoides polygyrus TaxID=6339 RepID=A0A183G6K8_HELPZ|nr:unnamed protein product [Heligmosomoides polygyrus]